LFLLFSSLLVFSIVFPVLITVEYTLACYMVGLSQDKSRTEKRDRVHKKR
jgi:cytochrome bd-type quinol oxidase subunit 1